MPRALVRVVGSDSGALSLTAVQAAVTKKTKAASAFAFASFATLFLALLWAASQHNQAQLEGDGEAARRAPLPLPAGHEVRLEAVEGSGGRDLAAVLEAAE